MATSPKRYGIDQGRQNLELELRLRRIEAELERCVKSSDIGEGSENTQRITNIPQVTGLRVTGKTAGAVSLAWNQVRISDLRRYELWIAEDLAFSENLQTFYVATTEYTFSTLSTTGGGGNTTIYAKVRARNKSGNVGPFSVVLDTATGQAQTDDIADGSVTVEKVTSDDPDAPKVWTEENDGPDSGLDADTVDGLHKTDLLTFETDTPLYYQSSLTAITTDTDHVFPHGLGGIPRLFQAFLVCTQADLGYAVGDVVLVGAEGSGTASSEYGIVCFANSTNIVVRVATSAFRLIDSVLSYEWEIADETKWKLYIRAWK